MPESVGSRAPDLGSRSGGIVVRPLPPLLAGEAHAARRPPKPASRPRVVSSPWGTPCSPRVFRAAFFPRLHFAPRSIRSNQDGCVVGKHVLVRETCVSRYLFYKYEFVKHPSLQNGAECSLLYRKTTFTSKYFASTSCFQKKCGCIIRSIYALHSINSNKCIWRFVQTIEQPTRVGRLSPPAQPTQLQIASGYVRMTWPDSTIVSQVRRWL